MKATYQFYFFIVIVTVFTTGCSMFNSLSKKDAIIEPIVKKEIPDSVRIATIPMTDELEYRGIDPILPNIDDLLNVQPNYVHIPPTFYAVVQPYQKMRNDSQGDGHFGASRGRRRHNGIDIIVLPGSAVYCPIEGFMKRIAHPYPGRRNKKWLGCVIEGTGLYRGYEVKIFYMKPFLIGEYVYPSDVIGKAQAISDKYSSAMIDHLHVEVRYYGRLIDPATLFSLVK